jgi:uncharacterized membrane protein YkoI
MNQNVYRALALVCLVGSAGGCHSASSPPPRISMDAARQTALAKVPGEVKQEELEEEDGREIYSFVIKPTAESRAIVKEVNVDAHSGDVVALEEEPE